MTVKEQEKTRGGNENDLDFSNSRCRSVFVKCIKLDAGNWCMLLFAHHTSTTLIEKIL